MNVCGQAQGVKFISIPSHRELQHESTGPWAHTWNLKCNSRKPLLQYDIILISAVAEALFSVHAYRLASCAWWRMFLCCHKFAFNIKCERRADQTQKIKCQMQWGISRCFIILISCYSASVLFLSIRSLPPSAFRPAAVIVLPQSFHDEIENMWDWLFLSSFIFHQFQFSQGHLA